MALQLAENITANRKQPAQGAITRMRPPHLVGLSCAWSREMESNSNGLSYSAGREVLRRVIWEQEMLLIAQLVLCYKKKKKKKKKGSPFCISPILLAENS